jgi:DNA-binding transcriptional LysR family regulator
VTVSNFSGLPAFLRGTDLLASAPERMSTQLMRDFAYVPLPFEYNPFTLLMLWHRRHQTDPAHRWVRNQVNSVAATMNGLHD